MPQMNWTVRILAGVACVFSLTAPARAVTTNSSPEIRDYRVIVERNPFGLKPPPAPVTNAPAPPPPKDEVLLTGITSFGGLRAYFETKPPQGKNPERYSLGLDEKKNGLEILGIDPMNKNVRVRQGGVEAVMTFAANGVKAPSAPATAPPGGHTAVAGNAPAAPGANATPFPPPLASVLPANTPNPNNRLRNVPSRNMRTPPPLAGGSVPNQPAAAPNPYAAEQDILLMELQKAANPNVVYPPTPGMK